MFELLGIVFGGVSRLVQHYMEMQDKQRERDHELNMFDRQITLQTQRIEAEKDLRQMDADAQRDAGELNALVAAINDQSQQASAAGGWVAKLSASVRPVISYWLLAIYSAAKASAFFIVLNTGVSLADAVTHSYTTFDGALLGSIVSFWFADRSLRKAGK